MPQIAAHPSPEGAPSWLAKASLAMVTTICFADSLKRRLKQTSFDTCLFHWRGSTWLLDEELVSGCRHCCRDAERFDMEGDFLDIFLGARDRAQRREKTKS
jgi:hypothetical protein